MRYAFGVRTFHTFEEVEAWLEPMGYEAFWAAIGDIGLYGAEDRAHCDRTLAEGIADMETVMTVTKRMALFALVAQWDLPFACDRPQKPTLTVVR